MTRDTPVARYGVATKDQTQGGMPCPSCGAHIPMTIQDLLGQRAFRCRAPGCRVNLRLDPRTSSAALSALRAFRDRMAAARP